MSSITTVAGIGEPGKFELAVNYRRLPGVIGGGYSGDGGPAVSAMVHVPEGIALGPDGNLYFADTGNDRVRKLDVATGIITTVADGGAVRGERMETRFLESGDLQMTFTHFSPPTAIAVDSQGIIFIADSKSNRVLRIVP